MAENSVIVTVSDPSEIAESMMDPEGTKLIRSTVRRMSKAEVVDLFTENLELKRVNGILRGEIDRLRGDMRILAACAKSVLGEIRRLKKKHRMAGV